jgi:phospholipase C
MRPVLRRAGLVPAVTLILLAAAPGPASGAASGAARTTARGGSHRIRHVIEIMLENHTFAGLFPSLAGGSGPARRVATVPAPANEGDVQGGVDNSRAAELRAMDDRRGKGYLMNGYTRPPDGRSAITTFGPEFDPDLQYLARSYEFGDRNFQPAIGPTRPNIMMALNGTAHGWYYNRRDPHPQPWHSIFDELTAQGLSWKIYLGVPTWRHPRQSWYQLVPHGHRADVTTASRFYSDLATGKLPRFSFIRPGFGYSEEPREDISEGDAWLGQLVQAVGRSREWKSTVVFITYDEGGGFWDPVPPPVSSGYGTRTPFVIVSPWARPGVFRHRSTNISILSFMQHLWHLPPLTGLNARQNDLAGAFDFRQRPLPRPRPPVAPSSTIGFHGRSLASEVRIVHPNRWLRIYLDAETEGLSLSAAISGPLTLTVLPPKGVKFPAALTKQTALVAGRAMVRMRFPAPGYYRMEASGPDGTVGWATIVVLGPHQRPDAGTAGFAASGL